MMRRLLFFLFTFLVLLPLYADNGLWEKFCHPSDEARTKVWWFHGETETTEAGIDADLEAFKEKGVGGVVFYNQVHSQATGAFPSMSPEWWRMLKYAAKQCQDCEVCLSKCPQQIRIPNQMARIVEPLRGK